MTTTLPLLTELRRDYVWLFDDLHFEVIEDDFSETAFGNSYVLLHGPAGWLQLARDRGLRTVEFSEKMTLNGWEFLGGDALVLPGDPPSSQPGFDEALDSFRGKAMVDFEQRQ